MAFTPERGALIVDSQYENEDQQFLEEIHLSKSNCSGPDNGSNNSDHGNAGHDYSAKTYTRLRAVKTEPVDYDEQMDCSESGRSDQRYGEDSTAVSESNQMDYSGNHPFVGHSSFSTRGRDANGTIEGNGSHYSEKNVTVIVDRMVQEPGPIGDDSEEKQENSRSSLEGVDIPRAVWTPSSSRACRQPCTVDWCHPHVRDVLRDYRNQKINSREGAALITKITGSSVSATTVRMKSQMLDDLDAQYLESGAESRCSSEIGFADAADANQTLRENGRLKCLQNDANKSHIPGINAPIAAPQNAPYYLSFSRRFKQTSLTVPLNADEVRLYRHASHSKSGRTIHFRCSRCDTLHQTYKTGDIARIKMVDGIIVSQLYPVHHELCKPIKLVEARAKEIERRCRRDIIMGMNPKEAWKKGRKAAISEATAAGFPVYGPGSILSAFPEWDKVKALFGALRSRYIRRQMHVKQRMGNRKNFDGDEKKIETADYDAADIFRPKRPWMGQGGAYSSALRHDDAASTSGLENVGVSEGEEIVGNDFELDDFEEESLYNFMQNANRITNSIQTHPGCTLTTNTNNITSKISSNDPMTPAYTATSETTAIDDRVSEIRQDMLKRGHGATDADIARISHQVQEVERAVAMASASHERTSPEQLTRSQVLTPSRSSPSSSIFSAAASLESMSDERRADHLSRKRRRSDEVKAGPEDYITFVSPAGVLPCALKKRKYSEREAKHKLREIEQWIAQYNALSDNKIATIHMTRSGDLKMHGSKYIIDSCLHSSVVRNLKSKWRNKEEVDEEGVDDDELVSIPLVRCLPSLEINVAKNVDVRTMLNKFLDIMHFPWKPWFDRTHCPDYWPPTVPFYDPSNDLLSLSNLSQRKEFEKHSIVDLERDILKYAYKHYKSFMEYHFGLSGPNYDEESQNTESISNARVTQQGITSVSTTLVQRDSPGVKKVEMQPSEVREPPSSVLGSVLDEQESSPAFEAVEQQLDARTSANDHPSTSCSTPGPVLTDSEVLEDQLALFRNSVLRIRYDTMSADVRTILESIMKIQNHSTCRVMVLFVDERNKLSVTGDKTLISAFLSSNVPQCLLPAMSFSFDNQTITLPLLHLYEDTVVDQMPEDRALDLLEDMMMHVNFSWVDPYEGSQPDCWPPEIPFCPPWSNDGRGILNRRIGANTPGQAAKVVLKSVRWFYSELVLEKLKLEDGLKKIAPALAELTHNLLQERGSALQTPIPRSASHQEMSPFRVPGQVVRRSPSQHSNISPIRASSHHSHSSQELRLYNQPQPSTEIRTEFPSQDMIYHGQSAPLSPSQHSVSSQETVPFRLPPHHPLASAHLNLQQQHNQLPQHSYVTRSYESGQDAYMDDRSVVVMTPTDSFVDQEGASVQNSDVTMRSRSQVSPTARDFRMPRLPPQQVMSSKNSAVNWAAHCSSVTHRSRSSRSSRCHHMQPESGESVGSTSSRQYVASRNVYQVSAYKKSTAVRLRSQQRYPTAPVAAAAQRTVVGEEKSAGVSRFHDESATCRTASPHCTFSSECCGSVHDADDLGASTSDCVSAQFSLQQAELSQNLQNIARERQQKQHTKKDFLKMNFQVLCACGPDVKVDYHDCVSCQRCRHYFHDKCIPLRRRGRYCHCPACVAKM